MHTILMAANYQGQLWEKTRDREAVISTVHNSNALIEHHLATPAN